MDKIRYYISYISYGELYIQCSAAALKRRLNNLIVGCVDVLVPSDERDVEEVKVLSK
jgi:hypothetical protein